MYTAMLKKETEKYTYADYVTWPDDERWELIDGVPYMMGSPSVMHQRIVMRLARIFDDYFDGGDCEAFVSPLDVRLNADEADDTVVQPDLLVVCDRNQITKTCIKGVPDLLVEILSPSNSSYDTLIKKDRYQKAGVKEYWIADPETKSVFVYELCGAGVPSGTMFAEGMAKSILFDGLSVDISALFEA